MILVVDPCPYLERKITGQDFPKSRVSYADSQQTRPAGYGADMCELAADMNESVRLITFLGGNAGDRFETLFVSRGGDVIRKPLRDETQECFILEEKYKSTQIFTKEPRITRESVLDFYERYAKEVAESDVVAITRDRRRDEGEAMKLPLIRYARKKSKPVVVLCDHTDDIDDLVEARPFGIVIDRFALSKLTGKNMQFIGDVSKALKSLFQERIPLILVTGSDKGAILFFRGEFFHGKHETEEIEFDEHNALFAMATGILRNYDARMILKLSLAAAKSTDDSEFVDIKSDMNRIEVRKMEV